MMDGDDSTSLAEPPRVLRRAGAGFGSLALAALLADEAAAAPPPADPLAPRAPHLPGAGSAGDLPLHARRPVAGRHLRPQAAADPGPRQALAEALPGPDQEAAGLALEIPQARRVGPRGQRAVSRTSGRAPITCA